MYLTVKQCDLLDSAIKSFEVAFRSYISNEIVTNLTDKEAFKNELNKLNNSIEQSSIILSGKMKSLLKKSISNYASFYSNLEYANDCFINQKEGSTPHDVSYLSEIIGLSYLFASTYFSDLLIFKTKEEFLFLSITYYNVRNALSHRGSELISKDDLFYSCYFMSEINDFLDTKNSQYYWYCSRLDIDKKINKLLITGDFPIKCNNINKISFSEKKFVCRESELETIQKFTYPNSRYHKKPTSICIYGYGGVGKTALLHEYIKRLVKDLDDNNIDSNSFDYLLFYTAKDEQLSFDKQTGEIESVTLKKQFSTYDELKTSIFSSLKISNFDNFDKQGIIIIDNIESITNQEEHCKINEFIQYESPSCVQYIITSRKPEEADKKIPLNSFDNAQGTEFIQNYITENELNISLTNEQIMRLLELSRGNALVLVLSLNRLDANLVSFEKLSVEFQDKTYNRITEELSCIPPNAFEVISDFMYKNTIQEIEDIYTDKSYHIFSVLKALAVYEDSIDEYTLCLLTKMQLTQLKEILNILLKYLIIEKNNDMYNINEFANKYILERFLPNSIERNALYMDIKSNVRTIKNELEDLDTKAQDNKQLREILNDWLADTYGDKIAISKAYSIYNNLRYSLKHEGGIILDRSIESYIKEFNDISQVTMHPYVDFQKAASLSLIERELNTTKYRKHIKQSYEKCISSIRFYYQNIKSTYSFAIVLWRYGQYLISSANDNLSGSRYLEDAIDTFKSIEKNDSSYYQCLSQLGNCYVSLYKETKNTKYKTIASNIYRELSSNLHKIQPKYKKHVTSLGKSLKSL